MLPPTFQAKPTPPLRWVLRMPSIDPTEVPLFSSSVRIFVVQAQLLLPPPLSRRRSPSPLTRLTRYVDWYTTPPSASGWGGSVPVGCLVILFVSVAFGPPWWGRVAYLARVRYCKSVLQSCLRIHLACLTAVKSNLFGPQDCLKRCRGGHQGELIHLLGFH